MTRNLREELATFLVRYRKHHKLTQYDMAEVLGFSAPKLRRIEYRQASADLDDIAIIISQLDCNFADIFESKNDSYAPKEVIISCKTPFGAFSGTLKRVKN